MINNISNEMLEDAPTEDEVYYYFCSFIKDVLEGNALIVAHNASFDMNFFILGGYMAKEENV